MKGLGRPSATGAVVRIEVWRAAAWIGLACVGLALVALIHRGSPAKAPMQPPGSSQGLPSGSRTAPLFFRTIRRESSSSFLNTPLQTFTVDPRSAGWLAQLEAAESYGLWIDWRVWTPPVYHANASTRTATVAIANTQKSITIPYRASFKPDTSADAQIAVIDDSTGCEYEFEKFDPSTMTANAEATYNVVTGTGLHANGPGVTGGNISMIGGLITPQDIASGSIDHALRAASPINAPTFTRPGSDSDGGTPGGIPEGQLMRLDPTLDLSQFGLDPFDLMVARALQRYGAYVADNASSFKIYAENTIDGSTYASVPIPLPWSVVSHLEFGATTYTPGSIRVETNHLPGCSQQQAPAPRRKRASTGR